MVIWGLSTTSSVFVSFLVLKGLIRKRSWTGLMLFATFFGMTLFSVISFFTNVAVVFGNNFGLDLHYIAKLRSMYFGIASCLINYIYILIKYNKL